MAYFSLPPRTGLQKRCLTELHFLEAQTADLELEVLGGEPEAGEGWLQSSIAAAEQGGGEAPEVGLICHWHIRMQQRPDRLVVGVHHLKQRIVALWRACHSDVIGCMPRLHNQNKPVTCIAGLLCLYAP